MPFHWFLIKKYVYWKIHLDGCLYLGNIPEWLLFKDICKDVFILEILMIIQILHFQQCYWFFLSTCFGKKYKPGADPALQTEFVEFLVHFRYLEKKIIIWKHPYVGSLKIFVKFFDRHPWSLFTCNTTDFWLATTANEFLDRYFAKILLKL